MTNPAVHLPEELSNNPARVVVNTRFGRVTGGRASTGAAAFLEIPYALPPARFEDPVALPPDFKYADKEYIYETAYGAQPTNDGQTKAVPVKDKLGLGEPSENPFLQFGSPHTLGSQAQYVAAERSEVYVNIGYRLSAFGFLACDRPLLRGNYGFKDQWLALEWIKDNIAAFGGDPGNIQVTGLSAGAHSVHQLLHHASHLPEGQMAPFTSAALQSNAILKQCASLMASDAAGHDSTNPKTPEEYREQFEALCRSLNLDPDAPDILDTLRDPVKVPWSSITHVIETDVIGVHGTFRGCLADDWLPTSPDPVAWQRSGGLANGLRAHGVKSIVIGDLSEEWYLYSIAHPIPMPRDIIPNLTRYFPEDVSRRFVDAWRKIPDDAGSEEAEKLYGEILSCGQVHLPVRVLAEDLYNAEYPVLRYAIEWVPEQSRTGGK
ncbi:hypothetical protein H0H92_007774 [Tricholoma furcatifolium]|nr:hypothetical protein H0H92_007774 [Tricholoma furcatifolium]